MMCFQKDGTGCLRKEFYEQDNFLCPLCSRKDRVPFNPWFNFSARNPLELIHHQAFYPVIVTSLASNDTEGLLERLKPVLEDRYGRVPSDFKVWLILYSLSNCLHSYV
jgi:hypothetical protein